MSAADRLRVTVAVPTFRRPADLHALLPMLLEQADAVTAAGRYDVDVLVVDNDPDGSGRPPVEAVGSPVLRYVGEPTPGIAAVRNRALDESARSHLLAYIDDDERPGEGWLELLLQTWATHGRPAAVVGRVLAEYAAGAPDPWIAAGEFFLRFSRETGAEVDVAATGNLLLDLEQVRARDLRFEAALGLGGGEDNLFSRRLGATGGRMVWCEEAVVVDQVPAERMTRRWVLTRSWGQGNADVLTELRLADSAGARCLARGRGAVRGLVRMATGGARWASGTVLRSRRHEVRGLRTFLRGAGMLGGAAGIVFEEYARDGGRRWHLSLSGTP